MNGASREDDAGAGFFCPFRRAWIRNWPRKGLHLCLVRGNRLLLRQLALDRGTPMALDLTTFLTSVLASGVISAAITAIASRRGSERAIRIENITKERAKWRDKIRELALGVQEAAAKKDSSKLSELRLQLCLNLNPLDKKDRDITALISEASKSDDKIIEFSDRVALLLKHDWDRAKSEAKGRKAPDRIGYDEFKAMKP
jgi:hypothetical protein